ncbi:MAG: DUF2764 family protein [Firmicutes bacterium]|nr:DUF2764 family protein [Bacillota bacterium]
MKKGRHYLEEEIGFIAQSAIGKSFRDIRDTEVITVEDGKITKGSLGGIIEQSLFGIEANGESEPDFIDAGIELKVTPYKRNKDNTLSAKERLVLNMIDYMTEYKNEFFSSHFWFKNNRLEIMWYLHEENKDKLDFKITNEILMNLAESEDIKQIEQDWYTVINKIKAGKAHEISEGDTMYLGACTKGVNASSKRKQPFSDILAKNRAFCFKTSYMTQLVRKFIGDYSNVEKILANTNQTFDEFVNNVINKYKGKTQKELMKLFNIDSTAKSINSILVSRMFGVKGSLNETEEFLKANIIPKTVRIEQNGRIKESMSFPAFKYNELVNQEWENSDLRESLESTKYLFFVFKMENNEYIFKGIKLWNMPEMVIDNEVQTMWQKTVDIIKSGNIVKSVDKGYRETNFPGASENKVCHVRPHARDAQDAYPLPVADKLTGATEYTKHCFWINNSYLEELLKEFI